MSEMIDSSSYSYNYNGSNECVFINTNNPKVKSQARKKNVPHPSIKPPFPPLIDPKDLLIIGKDNKPTRSPNAFIIYRKVFFKAVRNEGHTLPMTAISSMASQSWEQEPDEIKKYYKELAKEAYNYRNERFPKKINKRKKREKWNIISFKSNAPSSNNSYYSSINDNNVSENVNDNTPTEDVLKHPLIDAFTQINSSLLQELIMSNELSLNIFNNVGVQNDIQINNNNSLNHFFEDDIAEFLNLQQQIIYSSPNLSLSGESNLTSPDLNELINSFPIENLQQMENNSEQIEQQEEIQQLIINDLQRQQSFSYSEDFTIDNNNDLTNFNSFDDLNAFLGDPRPNFSDFLDNWNNNDVTAENFDLFTQRKDDLGITFVDEEFEKLFPCKL